MGTTDPARPPLVAGIFGWTLLGLTTAVNTWLGDVESSPHAVRLFQLAYAAGFVGYGLLVWPLIAGRARPDAAWWWLVPAVVMRLVLCGTSPSDDVHRYLWEGRVQRAGFNPYVLSPDSPELEHLRDENWRGVNHPDYPAIYGPLAQLEFRRLVGISADPRALKALHALLDSLAIVLLALWCRRAGLGPGTAKLYALCPLVITAAGIGGHVDSLMLALMAGSGWLTAGRRIGWAGVALGAAVAVKPIAVVLWVWLFVRSWRAGLVAVGTTAALYLPFHDAGLALFESLVRFAGQTAFFGLIYTPLAAVVDGAIARGIGVLAVAAVVVGLVRTRRDFGEFGYAAFGAVLLVMPVVHYWYLTWVLLFLPFGRRLPWLVLAASMVCYFEAAHVRAATGIWEMPGWVFAAAYLPFVAVCVATWASRRRVPRPRRPGSSVLRAAHPGDRSPHEDRSRQA